MNIKLFYSSFWAEESALKEICHNISPVCSGFLKMWVDARRNHIILHQRRQNGWIKKSFHTFTSLAKHMKYHGCPCSSDIPGRRKCWNPPTWVMCVCVSSLTALRVRLQFYSGGLVLPLMIHEAVTLGRYWYPFLTGGTELVRSPLVTVQFWLIPAWKFTDVIVQTTGSHSRRAKEHTRRHGLVRGPNVEK